MTASAATPRPAYFAATAAEIQPFFALLSDLAYNSKQAAKLAQRMSDEMAKDAERILAGGKPFDASSAVRYAAELQDYLTKRETLAMMGRPMFGDDDEFFIRATKGDDNAAFEYGDSILNAK